ncbi:hypothetical protein TSOC_009373, partial [Tetrabaena socialis]
REETLQVVLFSLIWVWALLYLVLQLRPLLRKSRGEMRRVAELLSQLPNEVDVDTLVARVVMVGQPQPPGPPKNGRPAPIAQQRTRRRSIQFG